MFTLKRQLLVISLITLLLPWAGCQYVREMETIMRENHRQRLAAMAKPLALELAPKSRYFESNDAEQVFFTQQSRTPLNIDGYHDDWLDYYAFAFVDTIPNPGTELKTCRDSDYLYLHITAKDDVIAYYQPHLASPLMADHYRVETSSHSLVLFTEAPGLIHAMQQLPSGAFKNFTSIEGQWVEEPDGYNIELKIPTALLDKSFRVQRFDAIGDGDKAIEVSASHPAGDTLPQLLFTKQNLENSMLPFMDKGLEILITDRNGWPLSYHPLQSHAMPVEQRDSLREAIMNRIYRVGLGLTLPEQFTHEWPLPTQHISNLSMQFPIEKAFGNAADKTSYLSKWYQTPYSNKTILLVAQPVKQGDVILGYVFFAENEDALLSFTNDAMRSIINTSLLIVAVAIILFLSFASVLSYRIRKLRNKADAAVQSDGQIIPFIPSNVKDEIGDLSRHYAKLLRQVKNYNDYLQSLSHKLAHELRTPLAIVRSSLEMMNTTDTPNPVYAQRATEGVDRLRSILNSMSEATQVEQAIQQVEYDTFELRELVENLAHAYQDTYASHSIIFLNQLPSTPPLMIRGNPELIAQLLDKLIDNAIDFAPNQSTINITLKQQGQKLQIAIENEGPPLPDNMQHQLFDSLVSVRDNEQKEKPHLGLGLHIVRLIAQAHQAAVKGENRSDGKGVVFTLTFDLNPTQ